MPMYAGRGFSGTGPFEIHGDLPKGSCDLVLGDRRTVLVRPISCLLDAHPRVSGLTLVFHPDLTRVWASGLTSE